MTKDVEHFSSILLLGDPLPPQEAFEAQHTPHFDEGLHVIKLQALKLIILNAGTLTQDNTHRLYEALRTSPHHPEVIAILNGAQEIQQNHLLISLLNPNSILYKDSLDALPEQVILAIQKFDYHKQNENFYRLFEEQNENLQKLNAELKEGVKKRKVSLKRSESRLIKLQEQLNLMYFAIVGIQEAKSISEIEELLVDTLSSTMDVQWVRILIEHKELLEESMVIENQKHFKIFGSALVFDKHKIGHIYFAKSHKLFTKQQESFLLQINEIVSIKINQLLKYSNLLITRSQWQQTFNAIRYPVVIVNKNYDYITSNKSDLELKHQTQKKCYEVMFGRSTPCQNCTLGQKFEVKDSESGRWYYVTSQSLKAYYEDTEHLIHIYQDVTEQKNIETQILEKTKLTDLGILAGSLAHELNNPLGGIITFLQLLKDDVGSRDATLKKDIEDLLNSAIDCKDIIQMILENVRHNKPLRLS